MFDEQYIGGKLVSVLLVDSSEDDVHRVKRALDDLQVVNPFVVAHDGREALDYLRGENGKSRVQSPYIVVLDVDVPKTHGLELLAELRRDEKLSNSVVFALTTSVTDDIRQRCSEYAVAGYVLKSRPAESLREAFKFTNLYWAIVQIPLALARSLALRCERTVNSAR